MKNFVGILALFLILSVNGEKHLQKLKRENFIVKSRSGKENRFLKNIFSNYDFFPGEYYDKVKHHRIVKKQMGDISSELKLVEMKNKPSDSGLQKTRTDAFHECGHKLKRSPQILSKTIKEKCKETTFATDAPCQKKEDLMEKHSGKLVCKIPDKSDRHYYFECEIQPDGCMKLVRKRCPENEMFSSRFRECIHLSTHKRFTRENRHTSCLSKNTKCPEPNPEGDSEPANEWMDAPQGSNPKIPSEFKPKPKLRLRIYHLRCKKANKLLSTEKRIRSKRNSSFKVDNQDYLWHLAPELEAKEIKHNVHRHHPRSYVIRVNKKAKDKDESLNENDEMDDEDDEDDDEDEDYENQEENENNVKKENEINPKKDNEEQLNCREGLRDLFKSAKDAVVSKIKNIDSSSHSQFQYPTEFKNYLEKNHCKPKNSDSTSSGEQDITRKVLIDADIKVDEEISRALKNILGKGMRKNFQKIS